VKIRSVEVYLLDAGFLKSALFQTRVANPLSFVPELAERRSLWMWPPQKVVVVIGGADGSEGVSLTNGGPVVASILAGQFARLVAGRDSDDVAAIWDILFRAVLPFDRSGFAMMAVAAIDIALWDLNARSIGVSLGELLGGTRTDSLPVYVTTTRPAAFAGRGLTGIKVPMPFGPEGGADGMRANVEAVRAARAAAGDAAVAIDAFMAWDADYTLRMAEALAPFDLAWIEDPLLPTDLDGLLRVHRESGGIRLGLGNFCFHRWDCRQLLDLGVVGILQPDVAWAGGLTECRRIIELAARYDVPVVLHNAGEQPWAISLAMTIAGDTQIEVVDRGDDAFLNAIFDDRAPVTDGRMRSHRGIAGNRLTEAARASLVPFKVAT
jgi:L-rhamnonate dehydratase